MARIRILPDILANKIAAGEVVERPASVVKELVENAIDAGADRIAVEIEKGGRSLIRVADNGCGMDRDDALLALERYATSKIARAEDLFAIQTLGFRGEALPSMASVSRLTLVTRPREQAHGTEIKVAGGKIVSVNDAGAPPGTMITVQDLFFNTPARRKFLKAVGTEMGHVGDNLASLALGHAAIHFSLAHNGRTLRRWLPAREPVERLAAVLGQDLRGELAPLALESPAVTVTGWAAGPRVNRSSARGVFIFVNGRWVRDRTVLHAVVQGYRQRLMKGQYPVAVVFLALPAREVDVNVHPTKHEVRFARQREIHGAVAGAVAVALDQAESRARPIPRPPSRPAAFSPGVAEAQAPFRPPGPASAGLFRAAQQFAPEHHSTPAPPAPAHLAEMLPQGRFAGLTVIGQFRSTYILCESEDGLVLIDQHAAHERVFYEQLLKRNEGIPADCQALLMPETLELGFREAAAMKQLAADLGEAGFAIEPFGGNTYVVKAAPAFLAQGELGPLLREILEQALEVGARAEAGRLRDESLKIMACHGAIRARQKLDARQIRQLLRQMDACANPSHCPHGRPTWIRWSAAELERAFGRRA